MRRREEKERASGWEAVLPCDGKFKNLSTRCRTTRGNFIISAVRAGESEREGTREGARDAETTS